jgi:hypothetical protein
MRRWTTSQRGDVLILRPVDNRSPAEAARIAARVMRHTDRYDRRSGRVERNLASLAANHPSVAERFGEAELRAAAHDHQGRCAWCVAFMVATVNRLPGPKLTAASRALLGEPCRRCRYRAMSPARRRMEADRLARRVRHASQRHARPSPAGSGRACPSCGQAHPVVAGGWRAPSRADLAAAKRLGIPLDRLWPEERTG